MTTTKRQEFLDVLNEVLDTSPSTDNETLAKEVSAKVPDDMLREAVEYLLERVITNKLGLRRSTAFRHVMTDVRGSESAIAPPLFPSSHPRPADTATVRVTSWKHNGRDTTDELLNTRVNLSRNGRDGGVSKLLRDCTAPDLAVLASKNRELAAMNTARARLYERLEGAVRMAGPGLTVGDLGKDAVTAALAGRGPR